MNVITIISTTIVIAFYGILAIKVKRLRKSGELEKKKRRIEQMPSYVSTAGVLGTFVGITLGLLNFDTNNIVGSIPVLLSGLSTAFFTSLAGMICSMLVLPGYFGRRRKAEVYNIQ